MRPLKALLIVAVAVGGLGLIARAAEPLSAEPAPEYLKPLLLAIDTAPTGEETLAAYARARAVDPSSPLLRRAFIRRMVALQRPLEAYPQAAALVEAGSAGPPSPNSGFVEQDALAWAVVALMRSKLELTAQSLEAIVTAVELDGDDPFVLATAGRLLAEYDLRPLKPVLDDALAARLEAVRETVRADPVFTAAYAVVVAEHESERQLAERRHAEEERPAVALDEQARREAESRRRALELAELYAPRREAFLEEVAAAAQAEPPPVVGDIDLSDAYTYAGPVFGDYDDDGVAPIYGEAPYGVVPRHLGGRSFNYLDYLIRTGAITPGPIVRDGLVVRHASNPIRPLSRDGVFDVFRHGTNLAVVGPLFPTSPANGMAELQTYGRLVGDSGSTSPLGGGSGLIGFNRLGGDSRLVGGAGAMGRLAGFGAGSRLVAR